MRTLGLVWVIRHLGVSDLHADSLSLGLSFLVTRGSLHGKHLRPELQGLLLPLWHWLGIRLDHLLSNLCSHLLLNMLRLNSNLLSIADELVCILKIAQPVGCAIELLTLLLENLLAYPLVLFNALRIEATSAVVALDEHSISSKLLILVGPLREGLLRSSRGVREVLRLAAHASGIADVDRFWARPVCLCLLAARRAEGIGLDALWYT
mmetsp:Transcript_32060/g.70114  ORF Transcript_32060/g.70114 Transcript_32060/m.70114 type:complete len:208 (-) Transcript_32060:513-1136(-)